MILEHVTQLSARIQRIMLHHNRAQTQNRIKRRNMLRTIRQNQRHTVAGLHTSHAQALRRTLNLVTQLGVRRGRAKKLQRHLMRRGTNRLINEMAQRRLGQLNIACSPRSIVLQPGAMRQGVPAGIGSGHAEHRGAPGGSIPRIYVLLSLSHAFDCARRQPLSSTSSTFPRHLHGRLPANKARTAYITPLPQVPSTQLWDT